MSALARTIRCSPPPPAKSLSSEKATDVNMYRYAQLAFQNKAGSKTRTPLRRQAPADVLERSNISRCEKRPQSLLIRPVSEAYEGDAVAVSPSSFLAPSTGP